MAILVPNASPNDANICLAYNTLLQGTLQMLGGGYTGVHASPYEVPLTDVLVAASDLPSLILLVNQIASNYGGVFTSPEAWPGHINDAVAHLSADTTNTLSAAVEATTLTTAETLTNLLRTQIGAHFLQSGVHVNNDVQEIDGTSITSLSTCITVANSVRTCYLNHVINAPGGTASSPVGLRVVASARHSPRAGHGGCRTRR